MNLEFLELFLKQIIIIKIFQAVNKEEKLNQHWGNIFGLLWHSRELKNPRQRGALEGSVRVNKGEYMRQFGGKNVVTPDIEISTKLHILCHNTI
jgi:hypothetical protein